MLIIWGVISIILFDRLFFMLVYMTSKVQSTQKISNGIEKAVYYVSIYIYRLIKKLWKTI